MKLARDILLTLILVGTAPALTTAQDVELPVRLNRLSERVVAAWIGEFAMSNQMIAAASKDGIVIIDTYSSRIYQERLRKAIQKKLGRGVRASF